MVVTPRSRQLRAIKIIRVSKQGKRTTERFISPEDQDKAIAPLAAQNNWRFVATFNENNVSGYRTKLEKRKGLYPALLMIERGEADVIVFGFRDRMARNNVVEDTFLGRVGKAGGQVWAADLGQIKTDTAVERLTSGLLGLVQQYVAESTRDKTAGPKARAVELGIPPFPYIPPGYVRDTDPKSPTYRRLLVDPEKAPIIHSAYTLRAAGGSLQDVRDWLRSRGIDVSARGAQEILKNRIYLGELRFGKLVNLHSHQPIIEGPLFRSIQAMRVPRGPRPESQRLFARQGLIRCSECNARMVVGQQTLHNRAGERIVRRDYRCPPLGGCKKRQTISAPILEEYVISYVKMAQVNGRWAPDQMVVEAEAAFTAAQAKYDNFVRAWSEDADQAVVQERKAELRAELERTREWRDSVTAGNGTSVATLSDGSWDEMDLEQKRTVLRSLIESITVTPPAGPSGSTNRAHVEARIHINFFI